MSFPRYPTYKPSGVEWLGEVPEHWSIIRLKNVLQCRITDGPHTTPEFIDEGVPFLSVDAIQDGELRFDGCRFISEKDHEEFRRKAQPARDDILMGKAASTGKIARVKTDLTFSIWSPLALIRVDSQLSSPSFYEQALKSASSQAQIDVLCTSNTQKNISMDDIPRLVMTRPTIEEQLAIATFLDHETTKIDALIAEQQRLIELLQEKRQAVISHAVTKGLNPDAPMKDSGVEWLGEVPEHWDVCSMRRVLLKIEQGWSPECLPSPAEEGEWGVVKAGCVNGGAFNQLDNKTLPHHLEPPVEYEIQAGDLLVSRASGSPDLIGSAAFIEDVRPRLLLSDKTFRLRTAQRVDPRYLSDVLGSTPLRQQIRRSISGAVGLANNLPQSEIKDFIVPLPPAKEQQEIHRLLFREKEYLSTLLDESDSLINLLQERRSALISAAVTGQIDVRGLVPEAVAA